MINISGLYITMHTHCNFSCEYCWQKHSPTLNLNQKLKKEDILDLIDYFFENYFILYPKEKKINIVFSGGEALFFSNEICAFIKHIREYNNIVLADIKITLQTNGSLLNDDILQFLKNNQVELFFSYDGLGQNITRQNNDLVFNNLKKATKYVPVMVNSVFTPETQNLIYDSFMLLKDIGITTWGFGIDFLRKEEEYDKDNLLIQIKKILKEKTNIRIRNFEHQTDDSKWRNGIKNSIYQISITPEGRFHPTNFIYTGENHTEFFDYNFGNINSGFNHEIFEKYCQNKEQILDTIPSSSSINITPELIVSNLFSSTSRFVKNKKSF